MLISGVTNADLVKVLVATFGNVALNASQVSLFKNGKLADPSCKLFYAILLAHRLSYSNKSENPDLEAVRIKVLPIPGCDQQTSMEDLVALFFGWKPLPQAAVDFLGCPDGVAMNDEETALLNQSLRRAFLRIAVEQCKGQSPQALLLSLYSGQDTRRRGRFSRWLEGLDLSASDLEDEAFSFARLYAELTGDSSAMADPIGWLVRFAAS